MRSKSKLYNILAEEGTLGKLTDISPPYNCTDQPMVCLDTQFKGLSNAPLESPLLHGENGLKRHIISCNWVATLIRVGLYTA